MKKYLFTSIILFLSNLMFSQESMQTLRGKIMDSQAKTPLIGVNVIIIDSEPLKGNSTDTEGIFRIKNVNLGRNTLKISSIGYKEIILPNVTVVSGKETILDIELEEQITMSNEA